jgi:hypothetical protein
VGRVTLARECVPTSTAGRGIPVEVRWLSIRQIAADLSVSTSTAYKWSACGAPWFPAPFAYTTEIFGSGAIGMNSGWVLWSNDGNVQRERWIWMWSTIISFLKT